MVVPNRSALIERLQKILKKHYKPVHPPHDRDVLGHLMYACVLEFSPFDRADAAFQRIHKNSFDLNEIRVTAVSELAESMAGSRDPKQAAWNLKRLLHGVFESQYSFDLEHLKKQNLGKTQSDIAKLPGATSFVVGYLTQTALGGHSIPLNKGALDALFASGIISQAELDQKVAPGLERTIPKKQGIEFASLLHQLGIELWMSPFSGRVRGILLEINPEAKDRLPKRQSRPAAPPEKKNGSKRAAAPAAKSPSSPPPLKAKKAAPKKPVPPPRKPAKKRAITQRKVVRALSQRKPR